MSDRNAFLQLTVGDSTSVFYLERNEEYGQISHNPAERGSLEKG